MKFKQSVAVVALLAGLSLTAACEQADTGAGIEAEAIIAEMPAVEATLTRIAFGSCADEELPQPIWQAIAAADPDLFLFIGDNIYADWLDGKPVETVTPEILAQAYARLGANPDYSAFRQDVPILATWDDHDYGKNDAGVEFARKVESKQLMMDFFRVPGDAPMRSRDGVYQARTFGPPGKRVQIIFLDTRWFRSPLKPTDEWGAPGKERWLPDDDPTKTMLGEAQWRWLEAQLRQPADLRLLVSSIQVISEAHGWEAWRTMVPERQRFFDLLDDTGAENLLLLSGDRHVGGLYKIEGETGYPLYEITSSSLNKSFATGPISEMGPNQLGALYGPENFGLITVDWEMGTLTLDLKSNSGETVRSVTLALDDLKNGD